MKGGVYRILTTVAARQGNGNRPVETPHTGHQPDDGRHAEAGT